MADLKTLMPHIRRAAVANIAMIIFFLSPSFLSFLAIMLAVSAIFFQNPVETIKSLLNCSQECSTTKWINETFEKFKKLSIIQQLMIIVVLKLAVDFSWLIPTWLLIILATQVFSVWGLLRQFKILQLAEKYIGLAQKSIQKVVNMIPKYHAK